MKGSLAHAALVAGGMMVTGAVMASSLVLPSAQSLAGQWQVANAEQQCQIEFLAGEQSEINGYSLVDRQHCLEKVLTAEVVGWRPAPDGIALLRADGSTLAFFSRDGDIYRNQLGADDGLTLKALV
ncbi:AprI/Inh family metalloprotease inhibitor [Serratia liquefaciens]|uniref:AprI/Inh family metalloprotease inhibitor n=1 Tax=Serratia liquefaciens TaxID=614 RepID=UPI00035846D3|nr:AprI/Inh family metalloprotease inhibitor [Serratia liquefaciens]AGQ29042.1 alkaline proteinase inhibitor [Serratia liquefaciens ATCC 27592]CAI1135303.1 SmaPI [Serratia liquefaciens]CAI2142938.1 SmaPI [Serratia liquefaciens]CAI2522867.1 SmaPI [Serratia liquefaciens]HBL6730959.1 AprI/Inh family metalloprotease inhibitor [Serratia liquefaciens]